MAAILTLHLAHVCCQEIRLTGKEPRPSSSLRARAPSGTGDGPKSALPHAAPQRRPPSDHFHVVVDDPVGCRRIVFGDSYQ
jgi:hypothetical protein